MFYFIIQIMITINQKLRIRSALSFFVFFNKHFKKMSRIHRSRSNLRKTRCSGISSQNSSFIRRREYYAGCTNARGKRK